MKISPWIIVSLFCAAIAWSFSYTTPFPMDDHFQYQAFISALSHGSFNLAIPGFHGSDFLATIYHLIDPSSISQIHFQAMCAIFLPLFAFLAGRELWKTDEEVLVFTGIISMMPFLMFVALRGWTGPAYMGLMLLAIALVRRNPVLAGITIALAILTKPFAVALLPLLWVLSAKDQRKDMLSTALVIPAAYLLVQIVQTGGIIIGSHADMTAFSIWQGPERIVLNLAHAVQILFSVHNYYFVDPALTGAGNMMHTTPVLMFLGLFALLTTKKRTAVQSALLYGAVIGIGLNALLDHMDHFYMQAGILCIILAAVPMLSKYRVWIPVVLATLHFQWLYFFLEYREVFSLGVMFFVVPVVVDVVWGVMWLGEKRK